MAVGAPPEQVEETPGPPQEIQHVPAGEPADSALGKAVREVRQIVESLEQALEQMEEVLRLVELAARQKHADECEIESLRRALRKIQPPRHGHRERPADNNRTETT